MGSAVTASSGAAVVVPLGLDLGLYRGPDGARTVPRIRLKRSTRELSPRAYKIWKAAHTVTDAGELLTIEELDALVPGNEPAGDEPVDVAAVMVGTPELMLVPQQPDDILLMWMVTNLRLLMVNVGPAMDDGALQLGLADERFDLITPQVFDVLLECSRTGTAAQAFVELAERNTAAGVTEPVWTDPLGLLRVMWSELPFLLAHGVAWLDAAEHPYRPEATE